MVGTSRLTEWRNGSCGFAGLRGFAQTLGLEVEHSRSSQRGQIWMGRYNSASVIMVSTMVA
jgi:hypothetical protein